MPTIVYLTSPRVTRSPRSSPFEFAGGNGLGTMLSEDHPALPYFASPRKLQTAKSPELISMPKRILFGKKNITHTHTHTHTHTQDTTTGLIKMELLIYL